MSTERGPELHPELLAALAGDGAAAAALRGRTAAPPVDGGEGPEPLPATATSAHGRALAAALAGEPVLVDAPADPAGGAAALVAGLLAALAGRGRRVVHLSGPGTSGAVRAELERLGLGALTGGADPADAPGGDGLGAAGGSGVPGEAGQDRWAELSARLQQHAEALHARPAGGGPTPFEALAELSALRAGHLHPPLLPGAERWDEQRRADVTALLRDTARPAPAAPVPAVPDVPGEDADGLLDALDRLPAALTALGELTDRLAGELSWQPLRTLADAAAALPLLERAETAARTYIPLALTADLDQVRAVLTQQQRSFLSAEERTRRREVKRLAGLRHDGQFGLRDVEALQDLRAQWSARAAGPLRAWPGAPDLAPRVETARRLLAAAAAAGLPLPGDPADVVLADLPDLSGRAAAVRAALADRRRRRRVGEEGLDELAAAVPAGAGEEEVARLVRATWLRASAETAVTGLLGAGAPGELADAFRDVDARRRLAAAHRLRAALADPAAAPRVHVVTGVTGLAGDEEFDVLVVDEVQRRPAEDVLALARRARQVVAVGTAEGTGTGDGSAWSALAAALVPLELRWPAAPEHAPTAALRETVATALRAAGLPVSTGTEVAGYPVDLLVAREPGGDGPALAVDLDGAPWRALPTARDRESARPEQLRRAGLAVHRVWSTAWFRDPRGEVQRVVEAWRRTEQEAERLAREEAERLAREEAERLAREQAAREEADRVAREEADRVAREEAERQARERAEQLAREEAAREEAAREEAERQEAERQEAERQEAERQEAERQEAERQEAERQEAERQEAERLAREQATREEAERLAREEAERLAREQAAREEAERLAREEAERQEAERLAREQAAREEAERLARDEAERLAREEAERQEAERLAREQAAREEAERLAREEAERQEAERLAREEAGRAAREEAERLARERTAPVEAPQAPETGGGAEPEAEPAAPELDAPEPPAGLGTAAAARAAVDGFTAGLGGVHPNVDQTPAEAVDAAVALAYAQLGTSAQDAAVLDAAMDVLGFRRRGVKVQRAFKESVQRAKKRMRGAGVRIQ
ncbi:hypothetical protein [Kineococcus sp. SYSU DK005]|uniref:hypothetical protein n=1 Tax=Kineococcus sp. SYSU DK005 TaxID=3383126 RepID=UPI003D7DFE20